MVIDLSVIKQVRATLSPEILNNIDLQGSLEYRLLCESAGALDILIQKLEKKAEKKTQNPQN